MPPLKYIESSSSHILYYNGLEQWTEKLKKIMRQMKKLLF